MESMERLSPPERFLKTLLYIGLVRGLVAQIVVSLIGFFGTNGIRAALGKPENLEIAVVVAGLVGFFAHMWAAGVFTDWFKWARGIETPMVHGPPSHMPAWTRYFSVDYNHKVIGIQYAVTGIIILLVGGILAIIFRLELSFPGMQLLVKADGAPNYDIYNTLFSAHGIIMIVSIFLGVGAMLNYLVPLMIGAADMAYPRLNALSYWVMPPAAVLLLGAIFIGGWDTGWVAYPPLSTGAGQKLGVNLFLLGLLAEWFLFYCWGDQCCGYCDDDESQRDDLMANADFCMGIVSHSADSRYCNPNGWLVFDDGIGATSFWARLF